jgi:hypothetical protein
MDGTKAFHNLNNGAVAETLIIVGRRPNFLRTNNKNSEKKWTN